MNIAAYISEGRKYFETILKNQNLIYQKIIAIEKSIKDIEDVISRS